MQSRILDLNALAAWRIPQNVLDNGSRKCHRACIHRENTLHQLSDRTGYRSYAHYQTTMQFYADLLSCNTVKQSLKLTPGDFVDGRFPGFDGESIRRMILTQDNPLLNPVIPDLEDILTDFHPDQVGISVTYRSQLSPGLALAGWFRSRFRSLPIVIGGAFMACLPLDGREAIAEENIIVHVGRGEDYFRSIFAAGGTDTHLGFSEPDFTGVDFSLYFSPVLTLPMITSRGCYWAKCEFCDECRETFRMDDCDHLLKRMMSLVCKYGVQHIHFCDHAIPPVILRQIAGSDLSIRWSGFVRATTELTDMAFIRQLAISGCNMLQIGFESYDNGILSAMNKGVNPEHYPTIIRNCRKFGIRTYVYLMFGYPGQTIEHCEGTLESMKRMPPDFLNAAIFRLPPGAPLARDRFTVKNGVTDQHSPGRLYCDVQSDALFLPDLRRWLSKRFKSDETIRKIIKNTPHYYKSSHAVYFRADNAY